MLYGRMTGENYSCFPDEMKRKFSTENEWMNDSKPCLYVMYIDDVRGGRVQA